MKKTILIFLLAILSINVVNALPGSYWKTCHACHLDSRNTLVCRCLDRQGYPVTSALHRARACDNIKNVNGNLTCIQWHHRPQHHRGLKPLPRGSYLQTCHACTHLGNVLSCVCKDRNGFGHNTVLTNPGQCRGIKNVNGNLICR